MKGKILSIITALLFGATMVASPIVMAAGEETGTAGTEEKAPAKPKKAKKKKVTKKTAAKKTAKKKTSKKKKKEAEPKE